MKCLVKCHGYDPSKSTWEKMSHLCFVHDLISDYERKAALNQSRSEGDQLEAVAPGEDYKEEHGKPERRSLGVGQLERARRYNELMISSGYSP
jgi:hypothetical protein